MKSLKLNDSVIAERLLRENEILSEKIMTALGCCREDAAKALREVLRFLFLVANSDVGRLTPSHRVDLAWHELILCTKVYRAVCNELFGRYIDHHPGGSREINRQQYRNTINNYQRAFGPPDPTYWGGRELDINCGECESV